MRPRRRWLLLITTLISTLVVTRIPVFGDPIRVGTVPQGNRKAGFRMDIEMEPVGGNGYQPLTLNFRAAGLTFKRDRYLRVEISPRHSRSGDLDFDWIYSVKLPEGRGQIRYPIYVPHYFSWDRISVRLLEDGREVESSQVSLGLVGVRPRFARQQVTVGIVLPADRSRQDAAWKACPDVRTLVTVLGEGPIPTGDIDKPRLTHLQAMKLADSVQPAWVQFRLINEESSHENWLGYSQLDMMIVAEPVLERIRASKPLAFQAMTDWLAAGGNLWVYAATSQDPNVLESSTLKPPPVQAMLPASKINSQLNLGQPNDDTELDYDSWSGIQKKSEQYSFRSNQSRLTSRNQVFNKLKQAKHPFTLAVPPGEIADRIRVGSFGLGRVCLIDSEDPFPGSFQFWESVKRISDPGGNQLRWTLRNGIDVGSGNDHYWMWLIESVGQPPVKSFIFLNTLFVIVIGPICYFAFRRRGRLYLLYFSAPALAVLVTASLFAYALLADGTRTQAKVRRISWIDGNHDYVVDFSRETYYAVFGSADGLKYPAEAAVFPVRNRPVVERYRYGRQSSRDGSILVNDQTQRLTGVFLPPRDQVQYLVVQPRGEFSIPSFVIEPDSAWMTHRGPTRLRELLVHDRQGRWWRAEDVEPGQQTELSKIAASDARLTESSDLVPELGDVPQLQYRGWGGTSPGLQIGMLEQRLRQWTQNLPLGAFIGTVELDPQTLPVADASVVGSVHVLMGELP